MNACLKTAGWLGAALPMFAAMIDVTPVQAQSSARELPGSRRRPALTAAGRAVAPRTPTASRVGGEPSHGSARADDARCRGRRRRAH